MTIMPDPFPHLIWDNFAESALVRAAAGEWLGLDWPHWIRYDTFDQRKRACPDWKVIPPACRQLLAQMLLLPVKFWFGEPGTIIPDTLLWGGGLHAMTAGDYLDVHLDHSHHPLTGLGRLFSAILFLNDGWEPCWRGQLLLWNEDRRRPVQQIEPRGNRLVVFRCSDMSFHSVAGPLTCPPEVQRKSLAVYFHTFSSEPVTRPRAQFFRETL